MKRAVEFILIVSVFSGFALGNSEPALRDDIRDVRTEAFEQEPMIERLDSIFKAAIDRGTDGDVLARGYLEAAGLTAERGLPDVACGYFRDADVWAVSPDLRARARFNYAQIRYKQAVAAMSPTEEHPGPDVEAAKAKLHEAARAFRAVLEVDPDDAEAARNTERVRRMIGLLDEAEQQAKDQADKLREQADKLDELADRQQQESAQNEQQTQGRVAASKDQSDLSEETERQSNKMQESDPGSDAKQRMQEAQKQQEQAQEQLEQGDPEGASESQLEAAKKLREAAKALREQANKQEGKPQEGESGEPTDEQKEQDGEPGEDEGESRSDRFSEWLLEREQRQREQRDRQLRSMRGRPMPVERDW